MLFRRRRNNYRFELIPTTRQNQAVLKKIISGGQTGADRAALDFALEQGIAHGGWCPKGRLSEAGCIPAKYQLVEMPTDNYAERTERNVLDSDGTVIISIASTLNSGSLLTLQKAQQHGKPVLHLHSRDADPGKRLAEFIAANAIKTNVAGPRASSEPGIGQVVVDVLRRAFPK